MLNRRERKFNKLVSLLIAQVFLVTSVAYPAPSTRSLFKNKRPDYESIQRQRRKILEKKKNSLSGGKKTKASLYKQNSTHSIKIPSLKNLSSIYIPDKLGRVVEVYRAPSDGPRATGYPSALLPPLHSGPRGTEGSRLVVDIQDLHTNPEAQFNEAAILGLLIKDYGLNLVCSEGAEGKVDTSAITKLLKAKGYSYIVISPYSSTGIDEENYRFLLSGKRRPLSELIKGLNEKLRLPLESANKDFHKKFNETAHELPKLLVQGGQSGISVKKTGIKALVIEKLRKYDKNPAELIPELYKIIAEKEKKEGGYVDALRELVNDYAGITTREGEGEEEKKILCRVLGMFIEGEKEKSDIKNAKVIFEAIGKPYSSDIVKEFINHAKYNEIAPSLGESKRLARLYVVLKKAYHNDLYNKSLLDIGCGYGLFLYILKTLGIDAVGMENDKEIVDFMEKHEEGLNVIEGDINSEGSLLEGKTFHITTSVSLLDYIVRNKIDEALKNIYNLTKEGGMSLHLISKGRYERIRDKFETAGFTIVGKPIVIAKEEVILVLKKERKPPVLSSNELAALLKNQPGDKDLDIVADRIIETIGSEDFKGLLDTLNIARELAIPKYFKDTENEWMKTEEYKEWNKLVTGSLIKAFAIAKDKTKDPLKKVKLEQYIKLYEAVEKVNAKRGEMKKLSDEQLKNKTIQFIEIIKEQTKKRRTHKQILDEIIIYCLAVVREAAERELDAPIYDERIMDTYAMLRDTIPYTFEGCQGVVTEVRPGEGKTFAFVMLAYVDALFKHKLNITWNAFLSLKDREVMSPILSRLGMNTFGFGDGKVYSSQFNNSIPKRSLTNPKLSPEGKKALLEAVFGKRNCHIGKPIEKAHVTHIPMNDYAFMFLQSWFNYKKRRIIALSSQRSISVDEVDAIFIYMLSDPYILGIEMPFHDNVEDVFRQIYSWAQGLEDRDYEIDRDRGIFIRFTDSGRLRCKDILKTNLYLRTLDRRIAVNFLMHAVLIVKAPDTYKEGVHYVILDDGRFVVLGRTGEWLFRHVLEAGIQQILLVREGKKVDPPVVPICMVDPFGLFNNNSQWISAATGITTDEMRRFLKEVYKMDYIYIPRHKMREEIEIKDMGVFDNSGDRQKAIKRCIEGIPSAGPDGKQEPIIIMVRDINEIREWKERLKKMGKELNGVVLGKDPERDYKISKHAGEPGKVTIVYIVGMRGMDIKVKDGQKLHIILAQFFPSPIAEQQAIERIRKKGVVYIFRDIQERWLNRFREELKSYYSDKDIDNQGRIRSERLVEYITQIQYLLGKERMEYLKKMFKYFRIIEKKQGEYWRFREDVLQGIRLPILDRFKTMDFNLTKEAALRLIDSVWALYLSKMIGLAAIGSLGAEEYEEEASAGLKNLMEKIGYMLDIFIYGAVCDTLGKEKEAKWAFKEASSIGGNGLALSALGEYSKQLKLITKFNNLLDDEQMGPKQKLKELKAMIWYRNINPYFDDKMIFNISQVLKNKQKSEEKISAIQEIYKPYREEQKEIPKKIIEYLSGSHRDASLSILFNTALLRTGFDYIAARLKIESILNREIAEYSCSQEPRIAIRGETSIKTKKQLDALKVYIGEAIDKYKDDDYISVKEVLRKIDDYLIENDIIKKPLYAGLYDIEDPYSFDELLPGLIARVCIVNSMPQEYLEFMAILKEADFGREDRELALDSLLACQALKLKHGSKPEASARLKVGLGKFWYYIDRGYHYNIDSIPPLPDRIKGLSRFKDELSFLSELKMESKGPRFKTWEEFFSYINRFKPRLINIQDENALINQKRHALNAVNKIKDDIIAGFIIKKGLQEEGLRRMAEAVGMDITGDIKDNEYKKRLWPILLAQGIIVNSTIEEYKDFAVTLIRTGYKPNDALRALKKLLIVQALKRGGTVKQAGGILGVTETAIRPRLDDDYPPILQNIPILPKDFNMTLKDIISNVRDSFSQESQTITRINGTLRRGI